MTASVLAVLALSIQADTTALQEIIHRFHPTSGAYQGSETTWFGPDGRRLRMEERDTAGSPTLTFLVLHDQQGQESGAVYLEESATEPSVELFSYSADGGERTTTYVTKDGSPSERTVDELNAFGKEVRKRYYRADGTQYGEEEVLWTDAGDRGGWDFRYVGREGGASFRYDYETFQADGAWAQRLMLRDGTPIRRENRVRIRGSISDSGGRPVTFAPGFISTNQSETSPSFSADGRTMVFARYGPDWTEKRPFVAYLEEGGWSVEPLTSLGTVYNLAIAPDGETLVHSVRQEEDPPRLFRSRRMEGGRWAAPEDLTDRFGLSGTYPALTEEGDLLYYDPDGDGGDGIYWAQAVGDGFEGPRPFYTPNEGTTFDGYARSVTSPLLVSRCMDETCGPEEENGLWVVEADGDGKGEWIDGVPYAWGFQAVDSLGLLVFTDGEDILALPLASLGLEGSDPGTSHDLQQADWLDAMVGAWDGVLEYLDYGDDETLVTLPTGLEVSRAGDGGALLLAFSYGEPDGRTVSSRERLYEVGDTVFLGGAWSVELRLYDTDTGTTTIEASMAGEDNGKPARLWNSIEVGESGLTITRKVRYEGSEDVFQRHQYRLSRRTPGE